MLVGSLPTIACTDVEFVDTSASVVVGAKKLLKINPTPYTTTETMTFTLGAGETTYATIRKVDDRTVEITGVAATTGVSDVPEYVTLTVTSGTSSETASIHVTVKAS
jgi:hypothetical protein